MSTVYKIRHRKLGLYSTGGTSPSFTSKGKEWRTRAAVGSHLVLVNVRHHYKECDLVEYEVTVAEKSTVDVLSHTQAKLDERAAKRSRAVAKALREATARQEACDRAELARLKAKYESTKT